MEAFLLVGRCGSAANLVRKFVDLTLLGPGPTVQFILCYQ